MKENINFDQIQTELQNAGRSWEFTKPAASHEGGVWERKIGAVKKVLAQTMRQLGPRLLSREELQTILLEAACIVNNTPLWQSADDPNEPSALTPAMLLTLKENQIEAPDTYTKDDLLSYGPKRWRRIMYLADQFWHFWRLEYASNLQKRAKWVHPNRTPQIGDIVLLKALPHGMKHSGNTLREQCGPHSH